jgi:parallel beta-helix repeat protein
MMNRKQTFTKTLALAAFLLALMSLRTLAFDVNINSFQIFNLLDGGASVKQLATVPADGANPVSTMNEARVQTGGGAARVCRVSQMAGADIGAKINACDAALGASKGEIVLTGGGQITTQVIISSHHHLRVVSGTYTSNVNGVTIRLKDYSSMACDSWSPVFVESTGVYGVQSPMTIIAAYYGSGSEKGAANGENNSNSISVKGCHLQGKPDVTGRISIKAGTAVVTSSSPLFTAAMVDPNTRHRISIDGAGASGGRLVANLITTPTSQSATLDENAATTVTNVPARIQHFGSAYLALSLGDCQNCEISGNWFERTHSIGTGIGGGSNYGKYANNVTVKDNLFTDVHFVNIAITNAVNGSVLNNRMTRPGQDGGSATVPIDVEPNIGDRISGLIIDGNVIDTSESVLNIESNSARVAHSIVVQNGNNHTTPGKIFENVVVSNNRIIGAPLSLAGYRLVSGAGILVREANGVTVKNNYVQSTNHCILVDFAATANTIVGNRCNSTGSGSTPAIMIANSSGNKIQGNIMSADAADKFGASTNALLISETGTSTGNFIEANPGAIVSRARGASARP